MKDVFQGEGSPVSNTADRLSKVMTETWSLGFATRRRLNIVSVEGKPDCISLKKDTEK